MGENGGVGKMASRRWGSMIAGWTSFLATFIGLSLAPVAAKSKIQVECTVAARTAVPAGFEQEFCSIFSQELNRNYTGPTNSTRVVLTLARVGQFTISANVKVLSKSGGAKNQLFKLSVRDGVLKPSIAKTLLLPVLKMLE